MNELIVLDAAIENEVTEQEIRGEDMTYARRVLGWLETVICPPQEFNPIEGKNAAMKKLLRKAGK